MVDVYVDGKFWTRMPRNVFDQYVNSDTRLVTAVSKPDVGFVENRSS